ncbi:hypothetical protein [Novosphingobium aquiterrae]|uniref:hypothetical protein n=1 Tax=Novosphingobium aquiterrae TaxID=624388 RepID=UPI0036D3703E
MKIERAQVLLAVGGGVVGSICTAAVFFFGTGAAYGRLQANVQNLQDRLKAIERPAPKVALGDVCLEIVQAYTSATTDALRGGVRQEQLGRLMEKMRCFSDVSAAASDSAASEESPVSSKPSEEGEASKDAQRLSAE